MKARVLFLDQSGECGGAELCLADLLRGWEGPRSVVLLEEGPFAEMLRAAGETVSVLGGLPPVGKRSGPGAWLGAMPSALRMVRQVAGQMREHDVVYANTAKALVLCAAAQSLCSRAMVFHLHDMIDAGHFSRANRALLVFAGNRSSAVIANSRATAESWKRSGGRAEPVVIPNGFDPAGWDPFADRLEAKRKLGLGPEPLAVMVGRLSEWKGQDRFLQALRQVPVLSGYLAGGALFTDADRQYARRLEALAAEPGLAGRVTLAGQIGDVRTVYAAADFVVHASVAPEPFGRVIVEAMLAGRPVIAAGAGGAAEIVRHEATGLLVEPGEVGVLASAMRRMLEEPGAAAAMAATARREAVERFGLEPVRHAVRAVVNSVQMR